MRAKPSSRTPVTTPTPSTWPWTTCPPRRSWARSGSSRLTAEPFPTSPSEERRSVSCITSAPKRSPQMPTAVRHTPLTATESPSPSSCASRDSTVRRTPSPVVSTAATVPRSATRPVNTSPLLQTRADEDVVGNLAAVERQRLERLGYLLHALALERVARRAAAEHERRDEQARLVDLACVEERAREVRAALEQNRGDRDVERAELVQRAAHAGRLVLAGGDDDVRAGHLDRVGRRARRRAGDDDRHRDLGRGLDQVGVQRQPGGGV